MINKNIIHTDVLVLGSGPSGFAAAYTAAKNGAVFISVSQNKNLNDISANEIREITGI